MGSLQASNVILSPDRNGAVGEAKKRRRHPEEPPSRSATKDLAGRKARQILRFQPDGVAQDDGFLAATLSPYQMMQAYQEPSSRL